MSYIKVQNLAVSYSKQIVLGNLNFEAKKSEFVSVVGKSGCGKTTFLNALAGLIPFKGEVYFSGTVGMVFQNNSVFPWMTVKNNIRFGLENLSLEETNQLVSASLHLAEINDRKDKYPCELSGGQIQRVALARTLAHDSDVLLMDEPYGALDADTRDKMQAWLLDIWSLTEKTVIFVTHNIEEAIFLADRIITLKNGGIDKEFTVDFGRPRNEDIKFLPKFNELKKEIHDSL